MFFVDGGNIGLNSGNGAAKLQEVKNHVEGFSAFPAFYGCAATATYDGTNINVTAKAEFFEASTGTPIYLAVYLLRNETVANQASIGSSAVHKNLVIDHFTDNVFGELLTDQATDAGAEFTIEASIEMPGIDISNYTVVPVIWGELEAGKYSFFNTSKAPISMSTSVSDSYLTEASLKITEVTNVGATAHINASAAMSGVLVSIFDTAGQKVGAITVDLSVGVNTVTVPFSDLSTGMYIMNVSSGKQNVSRQFFMN